MRKLSAACALIFGLLLLLLSLTRALQFGFRPDVRILIGLLSLAGAVIALRGGTLRYLAIAFCMDMFLSFGPMIGTLEGVSGGWQYSIADIYVFPFYVLEILGLGAAVLADGRAKALVLAMRKYVTRQEVF